MFDWASIYRQNEDWYFNFITVVKRIFERCFPLTKVSRKRFKDKPWITTGLKISIKRKNFLYKQSLLKKTPLSKTVYNDYKNICRKLIAVTEEQYYFNLFEKSKNSSKEMWKRLGKILNPNKTKNQTLITKTLLQWDYANQE